MGELFHGSYDAARAAFRARATAAGFELEAHPIPGEGPAGEPLSLDVAVKADGPVRRAVVVSSGTHGVEGYFGSACQLDLLDGPLATWSPAPGQAVVLLHGVNPWGFAHKRRVDAEGRDLNRNFLLPGRPFEGAPEGYRALDPVLNPPSAPGGFDPFLLRAGAAILRHGFHAVKDAIAGGQYAYPKGLFFGGAGPAPVQDVLRAVLVPRLGGAERVVHLDLHTGTGRWGTYVLAIDLPADGQRVAHLREVFGADVVQGLDPSGVLYTIQGALGPWLQACMPDVAYDCLLAEVGTWNVIKVLTTLRYENRVVHHVDDEALRADAAARMVEVFCPADPAWRASTVAQMRSVFASATADVFSR